MAQRPRRGQPQGKPRQRSVGTQQRRQRSGDVEAIPAELLVYGRNAVREALRGQRRVLQLHALDDFDVASLGGTLPPAATCDRDTLTALAGSPDHQGIVARTAPFPYCDAERLFAAERPLVFCLDQVTDPHNLGTVARVCDAAGADGILLPRHRSAHVTAAVCRASAGAIEHVAVAVCTNIADSLERHKGARLWVYGTSQDGAARYTDVDFRDGIVFVLGSEGSGMRDRVRQTCDELVSIPMAGRVSSLNVSTVAAVLAFEAVRQRAVATDGR